MELSSQVKAIAEENGAALVGIASRERLAEAPPSADPDYLLPSTRSVISFAIPLDRKIIRDFLSKKDWLSHGADHKRVYRNLYNIVDYITISTLGNAQDWGDLTISRYGLGATSNA